MKRNLNISLQNIRRQKMYVLIINLEIKLNYRELPAYPTCYPHGNDWYGDETQVQRITSLHLPAITRHRIQVLMIGTDMKHSCRGIPAHTYLL